MARGERLVRLFCWVRTLPFASYPPMRRRHRRTQLAVRREHSMS
jgi:hypothetical protein